MSTHKCIVCQKIFKTKKHLDEHMRIHTNDKLACPYSPTKFYSNERNLQRHLRAKHDNQDARTQSNRTCRKPFKDLNSLQRHSKSLKTNTCTVCREERVFSSRKALLVHNRKFHGTDPREPKKRPKQTDREKKMAAQIASLQKQLKQLKSKRTPAAVVPVTETEPEFEEPKRRELSSDSETDRSHDSESNIFTESSDPDTPSTSASSRERQKRREARRKKTRKRRRIFDANELCDMQLIDRKSSRKMKTHVDRYAVKLKPAMATDSVAQLLEKFRAVFKRIIRTLRENSYQRSYARIVITAEDLRVPISMSFRLLDSITPDEILSAIEERLSSDETLDFSKVQIDATCTEMPVYRGKRNIGAPFSMKKIYTESEYIKKKKALTDPYRNGEGQDDDSLCFVRCLVLGLHLHETPTTTQKMQAFINRRLDLDSQRLAGEAGQRAGEGTIPSDWPKYQTLIPQFKIVVWGFESPRPIFVGLEAYCEKQIHIFAHTEAGHAYFISDPASFLGFANFCKRCLRGFGSDARHKCLEGCKLCGISQCRNESADYRTAGATTCESCNITYGTELCYQAHLERDCKIFVKCDVCWKRTLRKDLESGHHLCMQYYCRYCSGPAEIGHTCMMKIDQSFTKQNTEGPSEKTEDAVKKDVNDIKLLFADFESIIDPDSLEHRPILLVVQNSDGKTWHWRGSTCAEDFLKQMSEDKELKNGTIIFHYGGRYDAHYILDAALRKLKIKPNLISRGSNILSLQLPGIGRCLDSYNHIPAALSAFQKIFDLDLNMKKGYFPYVWAGKIPRGYSKNELPPLACFGTEYMNPKKAQEIVQWYELEQKRYKNDPNKIYNLVKEEYDYCVQDVKILRKGFLALVSMFQTKYGVNPCRKLTGTSLLNAIYRGQFLPDETSIPMLPENGFLPKLRRCYSVSEVAWLETIKLERRIPLQHARNSFPVFVGPYQPDGVYKDLQTGLITIFEYMGCPYHGHHCQIKPNSKTTWNTLMVERRDRTEKQLQFYKKHSFKVELIYSCELKAWLELDPERKRIFGTLKKHFHQTKMSPLSLRESLKGGRTNVARFWAKSSKKDSIRYYDYTSLYPSANFCTEASQYYPTGRVDVSFGEFCPPPQQVNGFMKAKVQVPPSLHFPPLPVTVGHKLCFPSCLTCCEEGASEACKHTDNQRAIPGTWATPEIQSALAVGCSFIDIEEVYQFSGKSNTLLRGIIQAAYADKMEASGDRSWSQEKKLAYQKAGREQGIEIDINKIEHNAGLRTISKFTLNGLWGYFGMKSTRGTNQFMSDYNAYLRILTDPSKSVTAVSVINEDTIWVEYTDLEPQHNAKVAVAIASWTTSLARVQLYKVLQATGERTLYYDTDSAIVLWPRDRPFPLTVSERLGDLKDEIEPENEIESFYTLGSKTYSMRIVDKATGEYRRSIVRCKGISLSTLTGGLVNHQSYKTMVEARMTEAETVSGAGGVEPAPEPQEDLRVPQHQISRNIKAGQLQSRYFDKRLRITATKRYLEDSSGLTRPHGFRNY